LVDSLILGHAIAKVFFLVVMLTMLLATAPILSRGEPQLF
jgi:hypothetical protein